MNSWIIAAVCLVSVALAKQVEISNAEPRRDTAGQIMDIHDGKTFYMNGLYHYYGASYGMCQEPKGSSGCTGAKPGSCGFRFDHNVSLFTSPDLLEWTNRGPVFQMAESGIIGSLFCPKVVYNPRTKEYVLWFNYILAASFTESYLAVAASTSPYGPFCMVDKNVSTLAYDKVGDFNLFVDDDGTGYIIYTAHITNHLLTHRMSVEQLTDDYYSTLGVNANSGFFGAPYVEAPAMFKRKDVYYTVFGLTCCYCRAGSRVVVHTATHPLGPYTTRNNITVAEEGNKSAIPAQQTDIYMIMTEEGPAWAWYGDRWQSAPDGLKAHDFTYWSPLEFTADGNITAMIWQDSITVPHIRRDALTKASNASHVAVFCRNHLYKLDILGADGAALPSSQLTKRVEWMCTWSETAV